MSKPSSSFDVLEIIYRCVYKRASKTVLKESRVKSIEDVRKEYKKLLDEGWENTSIFKSYF